MGTKAPLGFVSLGGGEEITEEAAAAVRCERGWCRKEQTFAEEIGKFRKFPPCPELCGMVSFEGLTAKSEEPRAKS